MNEKYYSVEEIAELLHMHKKTIQRYIREGRLRANKIGKSWRVTGHDLSVFAENERKNPQPAEKDAPSAERVLVSCVMDIEVDSRDEAVRILNTLTAAMNSKPPEYGQSTMHAQYLESLSQVRVSLWGTLRFLEAMTGFVTALTQRDADRT